MITIKRTFCPGRGMIRPEELTGYVFSPEAAAHMFIITKMEKVDGQEAAVPFDAGTDISCRFIKANGVTELVDGDLTDDGAASITLPAECYQVPGRFILSIYAETSEETICIYSATATALAGDTEEINVSGNTKRTIDAQIAALNDAVENAQETVEQVQEVIASIPQDYTALSNSVSDLKSQVDILDDNALITLDTDKSTVHSGVSNNHAITFYGNQYAFRTAKYANSANLAPESTASNDSYYGTSYAVHGRFLTISGTADTGTSNRKSFNIVDKTLGTEDYIPAGNYKFYVHLDIGSSTIVYAPRLELRVMYADGSSLVTIFNPYYDASTDFEQSFTLSSPVKRILIDWGVGNGNVYNGLTAWYGIYAADTVFVDTNETVDNGETYTLSNSGLYSLQCIDTMQHESIVVYVANSKTYIDNHIPDIKAYWTEEIYALPEKFGAKGDGVTDDATALADCISYAVTNGKAIKGYGKYKTSSPVVLSGSYMNVFLREVIYTGNQHAVEIQNMYTMLDFHKITSNADGLIFNRTSENTPHFARYCIVNGDAIICNGSAGNCVTLHRKTMYNTCEIRHLASDNGNCIEFSETGSSSDNVAVECVFRESSCHCPNGYVIKNPAASKFYDFTIEGDCKYGYFNPLNCVFIGIRHAEQIGRMKMRVIDGNSSYNNGALFVFTKSSPYISSNRYVSANRLYWFSVDTSEIQGFEPIEGGAGTAENWQNIMYNGFGIDAPISGVDDTSRKILGKKMYIIGNNRVIEPEGRTEITITEPEVDFRLLDSMTPADIILAKESAKFLGTDFLLDVVNTEIHLNSYFGAIGYNDLTLTQENGNTAKIYDKLGNVLFDGTNEGNGTWRFQCIMDTSSNGRYQNSTFTWWGYDGTNEKWKITKIS